MCGIFAIFNHKNYDQRNGSFKFFVNRISKIQAHRGPEWSSTVEVGPNSALSHERLCIVGSSNSSQPIKSNESNALIVVNGEIYNYLELNKSLKKYHQFSTESDCECILHLYEENGFESFSKLDGMFAFVIYDSGRYIFGRDRYGLCPLYQGWAVDGSIWVASEFKCLVSHCERILEFPPGHFYDSLHSSWFPYCEIIPPIPNFSALKLKKVKNITKSNNFRDFYKNIVLAIKKQWDLSHDVAIYLSGGLKSTLITYIAKLLFPKIKINTFAIGLENSEDIINARKVSEILSTNHKEIIIKKSELFSEIENIIYHIETFNPETIRDSVIVYILSKWVKVHGHKIIMVGDGLDELIGREPSIKDLEDPIKVYNRVFEIISNFHNSSGLKSSKAIMAYGLEARLPFYDLNVIEFAPTAFGFKHSINLNFLTEIIREYSGKDEIISKELPCTILAMLEKLENYLKENCQTKIPSIITSCSNDIFEVYNNFISSQVNDERFINRKYIYPLLVPKTKEEFYYRDIFEKIFKNQSAVLVGSGKNKFIKD